MGSNPISITNLFYVKSINKKMEKRNGLESKVRNNLPENLVVFLKKERILCKFIHNYIHHYLRSYINQTSTLLSDCETKPSDWFLGCTFLWRDTEENYSFWVKVYHKYINEH